MSAGVSPVRSGIFAKAAWKAASHAFSWSPTPVDSVNLAKKLLFLSQAAFANESGQTGFSWNHRSHFKARGSSADLPAGGEAAASAPGIAALPESCSSNNEASENLLASPS